ncbi:MAG TPA: DUF3352 domain-containing protein [Solirubrobacteraceae bacterium]|nr:DUF3352 domain-containing protein [Solirubrobacteraceae bacterium]
MRLSLRFAGATSAALALALAGAGCGSSSPRSGPDPAKYVPATATLYVGAVLRPEGALEQSAAGLARHLTGEADPYARLVRALETPGSQTLSYHSDIEPWLGSDGGMFLTTAGRSGGALLADLVRGLLGSASPTTSHYPFSRAGAHGAILLDTRDASAAKRFLERQASAAGAHAAPYRGVQVEETAAGLAFAQVDSLAVIGSTSGVHEVIDTARSAPSLHASEQYESLADHAPDGAVASAYRAGLAAPGSLPAPLGEVLEMTVGRPSAQLSVVPGESSLSLYADSSGSTEGLVSDAHRASEAFNALPGESWLALGLGAGPPAIDALLARAGSAIDLLTAGHGAAGLGIGSLLESLTRPLVLLARAPSAASWEGPVGLFASGASALEVRAGLTIDSTSAARSRAALTAFGAALRASGAHVAATHIAGTEAAFALQLKGLPVEVAVAAGRGAEGTSKIVIGLGAESVQLALRPPSTMADAQSAHDARSSLGGLAPTLLLDVPTFLAMLETIEVTNEPTVAAVEPYLKKLTRVVAGAGEIGGGISRYRVLATLHN